MSTEAFPTLLDGVKAALEGGQIPRARALWLHGADLPLSYLELTQLNNLAKKFKDSDLGPRKKLRLALVASSTITHFKAALEVALRVRGFDAQIYESPFDSIEQEVLNPKSGLYQFAPTHALLWMTPQDLTLHDRGTIAPELERIRGLWERLQSGLPACQLLQTTFVLPPERALGGLETRLDWTVLSQLRALNEQLRAAAGPAVHLLDLDWLSSNFGKDRWHDARFWFHSKHAFSPDATALVSAELARQLGAMCGLSRKCLVLDLDNTLWGGVIGDDGLEGIQLGEGALGEAFVAFQAYVRRLQQRGVILAVCSKNNIDIAKEPFLKHAAMVLKLEDISFFVANWDNKADNIRRIAETLEIGLDSMVFCDDNPAERLIVREYLPEVYTVEMPVDPSLYVQALDRLGLFELVQVSDEDFKRTEQYRANGARSELRSQVTSLDDYLKDLAMVGQVQAIDESCWERPVQLLNKSNQFNLLTQRYTPGEFQALLKAPDWVGRALRLADRFGDNGLIAVITGRVQSGELWIQDWVMSCRVLSRGMESYTYNTLLELARERACHTIVGRYRPTAKNALVAELLSGLGFKLTDQTKEEQTYRLDVKTAQAKPHLIRTGV